MFSYASTPGAVLLLLYLSGLWIEGGRVALAIAAAIQDDELPSRGEHDFLLNQFVTLQSLRYNQTDGKGVSDDVFLYMDGLWSITTPNSAQEQEDGPQGRQDALHPGCTTETKTFGYANIPHKIPIQQNSRFPICSNTKLLTAVAIYQLHERGLLHVEADIATMLDAHDFTSFGLNISTTQKPLFCPQLGGAGGGKDGVTDEGRKKKCETITLRHLLSMSSGIYPSLNCHVAPNEPGQCNPSPWYTGVGSIGRLVGSFLLEPLVFVPGTAYMYTNGNFVLATYFVEKYSRLTFRDYLKQHIFTPAGMHDAYFDFSTKACSWTRAASSGTLSTTTIQPNPCRSSAWASTFYNLIMVPRPEPGVWFRQLPIMSPFGTRCSTNRQRGHTCFVEKRRSKSS